MKNFKELKCWQFGYELTLLIYQFTRTFPQTEVFGLVTQMRRSAVSVISNIAEGFGRFSYKDKARFYYNANGSLEELRCQLLLSRDLGYIGNEDFTAAIEKSELAQKYLRNLIKKSLNFNS